MNTNITPLPFAVGLLVGLVLIVGALQRTAHVSAGDHYREIYRMQTLGEKKRAMVALTNEQRREVWRLHFNDIRQHFDVTPVQSAIFDQTAEAIGRHDLEAMKQLEREADSAFPEDEKNPPADAGGSDRGLRFAAFGTIGPYKTVGGMCKPSLWQRVTASFTAQAAFGGCVCSIGSSFNMSCEDECKGTRPVCVSTPDGCGFGWLFACDGGCKSGSAA